MKTKLTAVEIVGWALSITYAVLAAVGLLMCVRIIYAQHRTAEERREWIKSKQASPHGGGAVLPRELRHKRQPDLNFPSPPKQPTK